MICWWIDWRVIHLLPVATLAEISEAHDPQDKYGMMMGWFIFNVYVGSSGCSNGGPQNSD
ncbi:MAG: hypothetical protein ABS95_01510 [Verrucomicrobia bacterium SCN 57-15]|nr:MAG: hypothetical protein ABS95_01510 [Verrucomicrobia bacterium SCN 57-15]